MVNEMKTLDMYLNEQLQDDAFRQEWEENQPEMDIIRAMADARIAQNLTQKELAERTGIDQADISKLENGTRNPSLKLLKRLADGMGMDLKLVFTPKKNGHREQQNDKNQRCTRDLLDHGNNHSIEITVFGILRDKIRFSRHLHPHRFISQDDKA